MTWVAVTAASVWRLASSIACCIEEIWDPSCARWLRMSLAATWSAGDEPRSPS